MLTVRLVYDDGSLSRYEHSTKTEFWNGTIYFDIPAITCRPGTIIGYLLESGDWREFHFLDNPEKYLSYGTYKFTTLEMKLV